MSNKNWARIDELFERVLDSGNEALIDLEPDAEVADQVRRLWKSHLAASQSGYLDQPITLVRNLQRVADLAADGAAEAAPQRLPPGTALAGGRFVIEGLLGEGGMGQVYLAQDRKLRKAVAIKTMHPHLALDPAIRAGFLREVRSAQSVTHGNVCRIHDIFEDADVLFYSMDYLPGPRLDQFPVEPNSRVARLLALQLAEGLHAAHRQAIIHRDFKPQNVILIVSTLPGDQTAIHAVITDFGLASSADSSFDDAGLSEYSFRGAGTREYMAPELVAGKERATVRSDIFAYGKVLARLLPESRWVPRCTAVDPLRRPTTLEPIILAFREDAGLRRRHLLTGAAVAAAGLGAAAYATFSGRSPAPQSGAAVSRKVFLNSFAASVDLAARASSLRQLVLMGLRQSPLVRVIPDEKAFAQLRRRNRRAAFPLSKEDLLTIAADERAAALVEGALTRTSDGLTLSLRMLFSDSREPAFEFVRAVTGERLAMQLAQEAVTALRRQLAESPASLASATTPLEQVTSAAPEAVDLYFRAITEYEHADTAAALAYLDRALAVDGRFPMAHLYRAQCLRGQTRPKEALLAAARAYEARASVTDRERNWIEYLYHDLSGHPGAAFAAIRKNTVLFPDEPQFQRFAASALAKQGRFQEALPYSRSAVELDEFGVHNRGELIANLAESGAADEAIQKHDEFRARGVTDHVIENGYIFALLLKERFRDADAAVERLAALQPSSRWTGLQAAASAILQGRLRPSLLSLEGELRYDELNGEDRHLTHRLVHVAYLRLLLDGPLAAAPYVRRLCVVPEWPSSLYALRVGSALALECEMAGELARASATLDQIAPRWPSPQAQGAAAIAEAHQLISAGDPSAAWAKLQLARTLWADPMTEFAILQFAARRPAAGHAEEGLASAAALARMQGRILKSHFSGLIVLGESFRAKALEAVARTADALRSYQRVDFYWGACASEVSLAREAKAAIARLR